MKNLIRATLVAGVIGSATVGLAGTAAAATLPQPAFAAAHLAAPQWFGHGDLDGDTDDGGAAAPEQDTAPEPFEAPEPVQQDPEPQPAQEPAQEPVDDAPTPEAPAPEAPAPEAPEAPAPEAPEAPANDPVPATPADADSGPGEDLTPPSAPPTDVNLAGDADPVTVDPSPASPQDIDQIRTELFGSASVSASMSWSQQVTVWNSTWVSYDAFYRPLLLNPYRTPLQVIYTYDGAPRIVTVAPLQRVTLNAPASGAYAFTAVVQKAGGGVRSVSVGTFTGGGHVPAPGKLPAPRPIAPAPLSHVLVQLRYDGGASAPFRVATLADLGADTDEGAQRVIIDGHDIAWGQWTSTSSGERLFAIAKTAQLPGVTPPGQAPLAGYRDVSLPSKSTHHGVADALPWVAVAAGVLGIGAVAAVVLTTRKRRHADV